MVDAATRLSRLRDAFDAIFHQANRLLRIESALGTDALVVERVHGREAISECYGFAIDCIAPSASFELKTLIGEPLTLRMQTPDGTRTWHGLAERVAFLGSDGGVSRYRVMLVPWLHLLSLRRDCRIFQDLDALGIIERILAAYPQARFRTDVTQSLATRPRCTQFRETDLAFVERLLAEEGLCYRFEHDPATSAAEAENEAALGPELVIFDAAADTPKTAPASVRFHRSAPVEASDTITAFSRRAAVTPNQASISAWDALKVRAQSHTAGAQPNPVDLPTLELYDGSRAALRHQTLSVVRQSAEYWVDASRLGADTADGSASARQFAAGHAFALTAHPSDDGTYRLLAVEHRAANNLGAHLAHLLNTPDIEFGSYRNRFCCVPDNIAQRPTYRHKPTAPGPETALVVGVAEQTLTSQRDHGIKVQFPWQRGEQPHTGGLRAEGEAGNAPGNERSGIWVRLGEALAGPNWGSTFVPRIGSEVLIDYLEGDIDQPVVIGRLHNGTAAPPFAAGADSGANHPGTLSGIQTHATDNTGSNHWIHDDAPGQLRQRLATSQADSALNLGYLIEQAGAHRGTYRGQGTELRTDGWAALRAPEGLLFSTTGRERAQSSAHDMAESVGQLKAAHDLAQRLSDAAQAQQASSLDANTAQQSFIETLDPQADGIYQAPVGGQDHRKHQPGTRTPGDPAERPAQPTALFETPSVLATTTPASTLLFAGRHTHQSVQSEIQHTASGTYSSISGAGSSLYTHDGGIQSVAAQGSTSLQAHDDTLEILADDSVSVTSSQTGIDIQAAETIELVAGQSRITLDGATITFACPGTFKARGGIHHFAKASSASLQIVELPTINKTGYSQKTNVTKPSQKGIEFLKEIEKLRLEPYDDQTKKEINSWKPGATIGYGHLIGRREWDAYKNGITKKQAEDIFDQDIAPTVHAINSQIDAPLDSQQFDALTLLTYNIGIGDKGLKNSSVKKLLNNPGAETPYDSLESAWKAWNKSQGKINKGLINRRAAEWKIYSEGAYEHW
ncbi:type VI secretion system tip protein TssI/VgrG [Salinisphaera sp. Q1T1-3]|uniref:type VI secretion system tip protein TssI/VgrG n=1 Tax=Salinisphaera sp. Q1T1-3 TaxID=2321229 RepID=UPI000E754303|nr:type VI secretion system tip protein TssI/VgrG [Salinisphaera sp. Q1T1-3]RJS91703.1 type VI secretion system tip protein VgrG [Salinisphaera sp. Q1T1-3]